MKRVLFLFFIFLTSPFFISKTSAYQVFYLKILPFKVNLKDYKFLQKALQKLLSDRLYLPGKIFIVENSKNKSPDFLIKAEVEFLSNTTGIIKINILNLKTHKKNYFEAYFEEPSEIISKISETSQKIKDWLNNQKEFYYRINPYNVLKEINRLNETHQQLPGPENKAH
jgi:hypothetical protein